MLLTITYPGNIETCVSSYGLPDFAIAKHCLINSWV